MPSTAMKTQGTTIKVIAGAGNTPTVVIGNVGGITGIGSGEGADIDVTDLSSEAKEFLVGLTDEGTISLAVKYDQTDAGQNIITDNKGKVCSFEVELPVVSASSTAGVKFQFNASVKAFSKDINPDAVVDSSISLRVTGAVVEVAEAQ